MEGGGRLWEAADIYGKWRTLRKVLDVYRRQRTSTEGGGYFQKTLDVYSWQWTFKEGTGRLREVVDI